MQNQTEKQAIKNYKKAVMKAHNAAQQAKANGIEPQKAPSYIVAENFARQALVTLNRITAIFIFLLLISFAATAQNATKGKDGNFYALAAPEKPKDAGKETGKTFTDRDGKKYAVLESAKGKLFYIRTSKIGNSYKVYIKTESK